MMINILKLVVVWTIATTITINLWPDIPTANAFVMGGLFFELLQMALAKHHQQKPNPFKAPPVEHTAEAEQLSCMSLIACAKLREADGMRIFVQDAPGERPVWELKLQLLEELPEGVQRR